MGILSSLYTGITGMQGQGEALGVYGDNIANANTVGFKVSRPEFQDVIAKSLKGLMGGNQIGRGTRLSAVTPIMSQGSIIQTESPTDLSITGDGLFVLNGPEGQSYTRNGMFHFDKEGKLINADGYRVLGFQADKDGKLTSKMDSISVDRTVIDAKKSSEVKLYMNLDLRANSAMKFDPERPDNTSHFATGATVYDTAGTPHVLTMYFNKVDENGTWEWRAFAKGEEVTGGTPGKMSEQATGRLKFNTSGQLESSEETKSEFSFNKGALPGQKIKFDFGTPGAEGQEAVRVTQYGNASEAYKTTQDGYSAGTLAGLTFNDDGVLSAVYSNGQNVNLAQIALAKFENTEGLYKLGQNRFRESRLSGQPTIGAPLSGGRGSVASKTIESSTTDIANEFINMMTAQRNFQANSKVISTSDEMMQEVINLRRN